MLPSCSHPLKKSELLDSLISPLFSIRVPHEGSGGERIVTRMKLGCPKTQKGNPYDKAAGVSPPLPQNQRVELRPSVKASQGYVGASPPLEVDHPGGN